MPIQNHSLAKEFPEFAGRIHNLKTSDNHFAHLFEKYDAVEHEIQHIESGAQATSDDYLEELKKKRLDLKDQLFGILKAAA